MVSKAKTQVCLKETLFTLPLKELKWPRVKLSRNLIERDRKREALVGTCSECEHGRWLRPPAAKLGLGVSQTPVHDMAS